MTSLPDDFKDAAELPITNREMQGLLTPLQTSLQRLESMLQDLYSRENQVAVSCDTPTIDFQETVGFPPAPNCSGTEPSHDRINETMQRSNNPEKTGEEQPALSAEFDDDGDDNGPIDILLHRKIEKAFEKLTVASTQAVGKVKQIDRVAMQLNKMSHAWTSIREPPRTSRFLRLATSYRFEMACQLAIVLNSALVAYVTDWEIQHIGMPDPRILDVFESSFVVFFFIELIIRLLAHRHYFFVNNDMAWNILDLVLVSISVADFVVSLLFKNAASTMWNIGFLRLLRFLKLARIFRTARLFRFCSSLPWLVDSFRTSCAPLFWGFLVLMCVLYLFALVFLQGLLGALKEDNDIYPELRQDVYARFGSLGKTIFTLYASVTGGEDWANMHNLLWVVAGGAYPILFTFFVFLATTAVFNIITGLVVERAMSASKPARSELILSQRKKRAAEKHEFLEICKAMDSDGSGMISWPEFKNWMRSPLMMSYMASLGCDVNDVELFFATVGARESNDGIHMKQGEVTIQHFAEGCMHMKGTATSIDMQRQLFEMHIMQENLKQFEASCLTRLGHLEHFISKSCQHEPHNKFSM